MSKIKGPGPMETPPGAWSHSDYSEEYHQHLDTRRKTLFGVLMDRAKNSGEWKFEMGGARISCAVSTRRFGLKKDPLVLRAYFDPMFGRLHVDTAEVPIRRGLSRTHGITVRQYIQSRRNVQPCHVAYLETGPTGQAFQVAQRIKDPCDMIPENLVVAVIGCFNLIGTEAVHLLERLG